MNKDGDLPELLDGKTREVDENPLTTLQEIRCKNRGKIIIGHLNINSLRNKFDALKCMIKDNIDICVVSETNLDESFPLGQFEISGFSPPLRVDRNKEGGGFDPLYQI